MKIINRMCLGLILLSGVSLGQEKAADAALGEGVWTPLYAAWIQGGEPALREYVRNHRPEVTRELILEIASRGRKERADARLSEARLAIALAAAQKDLVPAIRYHHENFDGTGYPDRLREEEIPLFARILSIAESFDAMTNTNTYRLTISIEAALEELKKEAGTRYDPELVEAFSQAMKDVDFER